MAAAITSATVTTMTAQMIHVAILPSTAYRDRSRA